MPEPITMVALAVNVGCGIAGNALQAGGVGGYRRIAKILAQGTAAENHDILKATHTGYVAAMKVMARSATEIADTKEDEAVARALTKLCKDKAFREFRYDGEHFPLDEVNQAIEAMFAGEPGATQADGRGQAFNRSIVRDLAGWGVMLSPLLEALFVEGVAGRQPWDVVFRASFAEQVKTNQPAFRILTYERLGELRAIGLALSDEINGLHDRFDRIDRDNAATREALAKLEARISDQAGVPLATLAEIARAFGELKPTADAATIESYLRAKADEYHRFRRRTEDLETHDNRSRVLIGEAQTAIDRGDFETADHLIATSEEDDAESSRDLRLTADQRDIDRAGKRVLRALAARLRGDYGTAIAHYDRAVEMLPETASREREEYSVRAAEAAREWGESISPIALTESIRRWRALADSWKGERSGERWRRIQIGLGIALKQSGDRQRGVEMLEGAASIFREIVEQMEGEPLGNGWAAAQSNLGNTLRSISQKSGQLPPLHEAIAAYDEALKVWTVETNPSKWAAIQNNLAGTLTTLGALLDQPEPLERAITAFQAALTVLTREKDPILWGDDPEQFRDRVEEAQRARGA